MDVTVLRWFQQVADGVTVTEVSDLEQVSQSGVSRALARLEAEVGVPLLRRAGRNLRMTQAGSSFKRYVDSMLHALDDGLAALSALSSPDSGTVSIAFQPSLGRWLVPDLVASFRARYPAVGFVLHQVRDELVGTDLWRGDADLELTSVRPTLDHVRWRPLMTQPLQLAVPPGHRLAARGPVGLADAAREPFVMLGRTFVLRRTCEQLCQRAGFVPVIAFEGDDLETVRGFVAAGLGVAIIPMSPPAAAPEDPICYRPITDDSAVRQIGIAWSSERRLLPAAENFRRHVVDDLSRKAR